MPKLPREDVVQCQHRFDASAVGRLRELLPGLPTAAPALLEDRNIDPAGYAEYFRAAVESIRGTFAATGGPKRRFIEAALDQAKAVGTVTAWAFIGSEGRQDYRVDLPDGRVVGIELKGCPDGNNMNIWELPPWANEFVIWSQCPDSLQHHPGHGVWSGLATRIIPTAVAEGRKVDALIFQDGRCGSALRGCPKMFGVDGPLRSRATDIEGQDGRAWVPPPCIYLLPQTVPHPYDNPSPVLHDLDTCHFARTMLRAFNVPPDQQRSQVHWAKAELDPRPRGVYLRVSTGWGLDDTTPQVQANWKRLRRA